MLTVVQDQWQRKKQTAEQKRAAKMAKLDPDNWKSAKDVMDERAAAAALKRKRDSDDQDEAQAYNGEIVTSPQPENLEPTKAAHDATVQKFKKQKLDTNTAKQTQIQSQEPETEEQKKQRKALQRAAKRERKQEAKAKSRAKFERQQEKKKHQAELQNQTGSKTSQNDLKLKVPLDLQTTPATKDTVSDDEASTASSSENEEPDVFSPPQESATSSISSILPTSDDAVKTVAAKGTTLKPSAKTSVAGTPRERLQAAIQQLRTDRKAGGTDGQAPKTRQELLDQRRRKEEERKIAKKEQKRREKEEEARRQEEEIARRFSPGGSGSLLASPRSPMLGDQASSSSNNNSFSFGRIAFDDGTQVDPSVSGFLDQHKAKGPKDTASALKAAQSKKSRLAGLDEAKRKEIEEKDMWLNAKRRAHGDHVRDDTSLLKKALKRQQGQKKKSEKEWTDRIEGVQKSQEIRQKKRNENLAKRKDEKKFGAKGKKVKRPGFEGSFKGRTGGKKK